MVIDLMSNTTIMHGYAIFINAVFVIKRRRGMDNPPSGSCLRSTGRAHPFSYTRRIYGLSRATKPGSRSLWALIPPCTAHETRQFTKV